MGGQGQLEFPDALGFQRELRGGYAPGIDCDGLFGIVVWQREPIFLFQFQAHVATRGRVVVDGHRNRHAVALGEGDGQIQVHEEILEDFQTGYATA